MSRFRISPALWDRIHHFASFPQTGASQFLSEELPIRLSHRVVELESLPDGLSKMPSINKVKEWYAQSFEELVTFPKPRLKPEIEEILRQFPSATPNPSLHPLMHEGPVGSGLVSEKNGFGNGNGAALHAIPGTRLRIPIERRYFSPPPSTVIYPPEVHEYNDRFTDLLQNIKKRHDPTVTTVAQGVLEWKRKQNHGRIGQNIQEWLDRFYMSRIGIRFLIGQQNARYVCEEHYSLFKGPPIQLLCPKDLTFAYVPGHLSHICFELLKNSLRAVVERYGVENEDDFPPIKVVVVEGSEDITIKISDEGGGIPRSAIPMIWTAHGRIRLWPPAVTTGEWDRLHPADHQYARFFGGDLRLISMDGYGTDVYISLNKLSSR
ncbi:hypothetical protein IAU60_004900 [Kwoniella sp. DSM 27419]